MGNKLHELLAVEGDLEGKAKLVLDEAANTFSKKPEHFIEQVRDLIMFDEARQNENTHESSAMVTTVGQKLSYIRRPVVRYYDALASKDATNQQAKADLVVEDVTLLSDVAATTLLALESKLKHLRGVFEAIPTLQPGMKWEPDAAFGDGVYRAAEDIKRNRTEKVIQHKVLYEATKEHPAQIEKWTQDTPVGDIITKSWSGMWTPAQKAEAIGRIDQLIQGAKKARQRANRQDVVETKVGDILFDFIMSS